MRTGDGEPIHSNTLAYDLEEWFVFAGLSHCFHDILLPNFLTSSERKLENSSMELLVEVIPQSMRTSTAIHSNGSLAW